MIEDNVKDSFKGLIELSNRITEDFHQQNDGLALRGYNVLVNGLRKAYDFVVSNYDKSTSENYISILSELLQAQENRDYILLADLLELRLIPALLELQAKQLMDVTVDTADCYSANIKCLEKLGACNLANRIVYAKPLKDRSYSVEYTSSGNVTIKIWDFGRELYISGNNDPVHDAQQLTKSYIDEDNNRYAMVGAGLLFEAEQLLNYRTDFEVWVYEDDPYLLKLVLENRDISSMMSTGRLHLFITQSYEELKDIKNAVLFIRRSNLSIIRDLKVRSILENYYVNDISARENAGNLIANFNRNVTLNVDSVDVIKGMFAEKDTVLIAGGPSLNPCMGVIKKLSESSVIVSVGTAAATLAMNGIIPDVIVITDVKTSMLRQLEAFMNAIASMNIDKLPVLLFLATANHDAARYYPGDKYIVLQNEFKKAELLAQETGYTLFETGGSVSTTAIDILIRSGAARVTCFGLDLAYTNSMSHANNTIEAHSTELIGADRMVKSVDGKMVGTAKNLDVYRKWIERRLCDESNTLFVNYSDGAFIEGMDNHPTSELL